MFVKKIVVGGVVYTNVPVTGLEELGVSDDEIESLTAEAKRQQHEAEVKIAIRKDITENAGDTLSLLGTTSDCSQMLLYAVSSLVVALGSAKSIKDLNSLAEPLVPMAQSLLNDIHEGKVEMPFMQKGLEATVEDIKERGTKVTQVLKKYA